MKRLLLIILAFVVLLFGCATTLPSKCDDVTDPSRLCDLSKQAGVRLEDVGNGLIVANAISIGSGLYTKEQALTVLKEFRSALDQPITYLAFKTLLYDKMDQYPGLIEVATIYFEQLGNIQEIMYPKDRELLAGWLDRQIKILELKA